MFKRSKIKEPESGRLEEAKTIEVAHYAAGYCCVSQVTTILTFILSLRHESSQRAEQLRLMIFNSVSDGNSSMGRVFSMISPWEGANLEKGPRRNICKSCLSTSENDWTSQLFRLQAQPLSRTIDDVQSVSV